MSSKLPRLTGRALAAARAAAEGTGTGAAFRALMRRGLGIDQLAELPESFRGALPLDARPVQARPPRSSAPSPAPAEAEPRRSAATLASDSRAWPRTTATYARAYRNRSATPSEVAERALAAIAELAARKPSMNIAQCLLEEATRADAAAATRRFAAGAPLGRLDGVPLLVKDEFDVAGVPTLLGTRCGPATPAERDATLVARLRAAGAVVLCKTVLTEWGMSPIGANPSARMPHNAHDPTRAPGGSSTGSAVGVALGLAPMATAADGGGSIRTPAALNGIFGIKPTFGRVSRAGSGLDGSVSHAGPLGASIADLVLFLDIAASAPDPEDPLTAWAPRLPEGGFGGLATAGVRGLRIGVEDKAWADADPEIARVCRDALRALEKDGAEIVAVQMPIAAHAARIGYCTIGPEVLASHRREWIEHRGLLGDDLRLAFAVLSGFTALEQLDAQRLRVGLRREAAAVLRQVDFIAMPTTAITAPRCTEEDARAGFSDPAALDGLCRYAFLANLTGLPAGTAPVGAGAGLPIGLQILGDAWDEAGVLGVLAHLERSGVAEVRRPAGAIELVPA